MVSQRDIDRAVELLNNQPGKCLNYPDIHRDRGLLGRPYVLRFRLKFWRIYNHRWQVESVFSRNKRLLGSALRNHSESARQRECLLRALTHNLMIIRHAS